MEDLFTIVIASLQEGGEEVIDFSSSPDFLQVSEEELAFADPVTVKGKGYLANDNLIIQGTLKTSALIPCAICNEPVRVSLSLDDWIHVEPLKKIKGGTFNLAPIIRETLLLEVPHRAECNQGNCPQRAHLAKYFSKNQE